MFGLFRHNLNKQSAQQQDSAKQKSSTESDKSTASKAQPLRLSPHEFESFLQIMQDIASGKLSSSDEQKQQAQQILNDMPLIQEFIRSAHQMDYEIYNAPSYVSNIDPKLAFMTGIAGPIRLLNLGVVFIQNSSVDQNRPNFWINWSQGPINFDSRFPHILFTFGKSESDSAVSSHACSNISINAEPPQLPFLASPISNQKPNKSFLHQDSNLSTVNSHHCSLPNCHSLISDNNNYPKAKINESESDISEHNNIVSTTIDSCDDIKLPASSKLEAKNSSYSLDLTSTSSSFEIKSNQNNSDAAFEVNHPDSYQIPLEDQLASPWLPELKLQQVRDVMLSSFKMQDRYTTLQAAARFGYFLTSKFDAYLEPELQMLKHAWIDSGKPDRTPNALAWDACYTAHILTTGADIGYLEQSEALVLFSDIKDKVLHTFNSWEEFSCALESQIERTTFADDEFKYSLQSTIQQMRLCKYSPWNEIINPWPLFGL